MPDFGFARAFTRRHGPEANFFPAALNKFPTAANRALTRAARARFHAFTSLARLLIGLRHDHPT
jgi:hypothetical protein